MHDVDTPGDEDDEEDLDDADTPGDEDYEEEMEGASYLQRLEEYIRMLDMAREEVGQHYIRNFDLKGGFVRF